ncbi:MAG: hypothetical protein G3M70_11680 [Candidatus Nitronauta litoralis]|uniref:Cytochrome b561 bacterial/Ni-hydrogenase domain-containing protein n=1 Tax=Candidatus Nitronauta litoralis TaxID=2705533 RepID=A0A7T0G113_9BACT|nr:MAG: hypothetical protein G3M70_11680 [Candidatus Nitronauta litoralis]
MSFFKLTIAEDPVEKKTEGYQNRISMLYGFSIAFAVTLVSGFWYYLVPRDINWNSSQTVLVLHLAGGVMTLFLFVVFYFLHMKDQAQGLFTLFMPWKLKRNKDEENQKFRQRQLGFALTWVFLVIFATGLVIAIPGLLFYSGLVWMKGYYNSQILISAHLLASVILIPVIFIHMLWIVRKGGRQS